MRVAIVDGYVDEPSQLGVPPYIGYQIRLLYGAVLAGGGIPKYTSIDTWRKTRTLPEADVYIILAGAVVPGRYARGMPINEREAVSIAHSTEAPVHLCGACARYGFGSRTDSRGSTGGSGRMGAASTIFTSVIKKDPEMFVLDLVSGKEPVDRKGTYAEREPLFKAGAACIQHHDDHPEPLLVEVELGRGCPRYVTGGCSFCMEPGFGTPVYREVKDVLSEMKALSKAGATRFRLGGISDIFSFRSSPGEDRERPIPNPKAWSKLLKGIHKVVSDLEVLHVDNANPAVMGAHPEESEEIVELLVDYCTAGNVLSLGLESADPAVAEVCNLNSTPDEVLDIIDMVTEMGGEVGDNGFPKLLAGVNLLWGLKGSTRETQEHDLDFLEDIIDSEAMVRRVNVRQVMYTDPKAMRKRRSKGFGTFKEDVRELFDKPMLERVFPKGRILRHLWVEGKWEGRYWCRNVGTYPLLCGSLFPLPEASWVDVMITDQGRRTLKVIPCPIPWNRLSLPQVRSLPGLGDKRANRVFDSLPLKSYDDLVAVLDEPEVLDWIPEEAHDFS